MNRTTFLTTGNKKLFVLTHPAILKRDDSRKQWQSYAEAQKKLLELNKK